MRTRITKMLSFHCTQVVIIYRVLTYINSLVTYKQVSLMFHEIQQFLLHIFINTLNTYIIICVILETMRFPSTTNNSMSGVFRSAGRLNCTN